MSMIPFESSPLVAYGNSLNELMINMLDPMGYFANFAVQVIAPLFPSVPTIIPDEPDFELSDFLVWVRPLKEYLDDGEDSSFYPLYLVLSTLAKERIRWTYIQNEIIWKRLIALYVAHYMELTINSWKDEANRMSLNPYQKEKDYKYTLEVGGQAFEDFKETQWGRQFWFEYRPYGQFVIWGVV